MSDPSIAAMPSLAGADTSAETDWCVRTAAPADAPAIAAAVAALLTELGGTPPASADMQRTALALLEDPDGGALFVAQARGELVGVLSASWQTAIHIPGRYALIQDLWVHPSWRSKAIGGELIDALCELASQQAVARIEVGLPKSTFASVDATEAFYRRNGFAPLGPRMRRPLS